MVIFWWTCKGYLTAIIVLAVFTTFGIMVRIGDPFLQDTPAYWGLAGIVSAAADWLVGRRVNAKAIASVRSVRFRHKLIYRARHKFMSLPLELWSVPLMLGGIAAVIYGLTHPS
jgi:hypothetical protein